MFTKKKSYSFIVLWFFFLLKLSYLIFIQPKVLHYKSKNIIYLERMKALIYNNILISTIGQTIIIYLKLMRIEVLKVSDTFCVT